MPLINYGGISGGDATPGGADTEIQFNSSASFAGSPSLLWLDSDKVFQLGNDSALRLLEVTPVLAFDQLLTGGSLTADHEYFYCITRVDVLGNETIASNVVSATPTGSDLKVRLFKNNVAPGAGAFLKLYRSDSASFGATSFLFSVADDDQPTYLVDDGATSLTSGTPPASTSAAFIHFSQAVTSNNRVNNWIGRMGMVSDTDGLWYLIHNEFDGSARWDRDFALAQGYDGTWLNAKSGKNILFAIDGREGGSSPGTVMTIGGSNGGTLTIGSGLDPRNQTKLRINDGNLVLQLNVDDETINSFRNYDPGSSAVCTLKVRSSNVDNLSIRGFGHGFSSSGFQQADGVSLEAPGKMFLVSTNDNPIKLYANSAEVLSVSSSAITGQKLLDLSPIAAGSPTFKITKTSDTPVTTYTAHVPSTDPAGFIEIRDEADAVRYIPFYT